MLHQVRLFFVALQFFTRLPVPRWVGFDPAWLHHAARYFPLIGLVVAAACAAVYWAALQVWPAPVAVQAPPPLAGDRTSDGPAPARGAP